VTIRRQQHQQRGDDLHRDRAVRDLPLAGGVGAGDDVRHHDARVDLRRERAEVVRRREHRVGGAPDRPPAEALRVRVVVPLVVLFDYIVKGINKIIGGSAAIESTYVTRDEIQDIIETGEREGVIEEEEREMLDRIFRFNNTIAKEVMTPRLDVTAVAKESSVEEAIETCIQADHERVPVYEGNLDNIIGVVTVRDPSANCATPRVSRRWSAS